VEKILNETALLEAISRTEGAAVSPASFRLERLPGDGSDRRYWRARWTSNHDSKSFVIMDLVGVRNVVRSEEVTLYHPEDGELPFLNIHRFLSSIEIPVPRIHHYDRENGFVLLQDLGDQLLLDAVHDDPSKKEKLYRRAAETLVRIHVEGTRRRDDRCMAFRQSFQIPLLMWEMRHFTEYGIGKRRGCEQEVNPEDLREMEEGYRIICDRLASAPVVFTHRDYHSRNLLVRGDDLFVIDFQDALLGPVAYDLASLLRDSYIDVGAEFVDEMVEYYCLLCERAGEGAADRLSFRRDFDFQCLQRNLKAAGRFVFFDVVKGNPKFLADIPRTLSYVKSNLAKYPELKGLKIALSRYVPELGL
jgi:N-acetylmuramate 1-kinase